MNKNLVICPTINRPVQFARMIKSFYNTSVHSDLIMLTEKGNITGLINSVNYDKYDYLSVTNDDFIYNTHGWDKKLIDTIERKKGYGIAFGNDGSNNTQLPTTCIMSTNIPRALGWIQLPTLHHLCGDMVWQTIGKILNCLYYVPSVKVEHMHFIHGKSDKAQYSRTNSDYIYRKDTANFKKWLLHDSKRDIERIKSVLGLH